MRYLLLPPLAVALLIAACGGGDSSSPTPTVDFRAAAEGAAADALIGLEDLPQFWTTGTAEDESLELGLSPQCDVFNPEIGFPGAVTIHMSPVFLGSGERQASFLTAVFREQDAAADAITSQDELVERCHDEFLEAMEQAARDEAAAIGVELGPLAQIDVSLEETDFPSLGDQSRARRAQVEVRIIGITTRFAADILVVRSGRTTGVMIYSNFDFIEEEEEEIIARAMLDKLQAADSTLPE